MKTALHFRILTILLLLPLIAVSSNWKGKYTKEKKLHEEYSVDANATLRVDNSYGDVVVTTWNENRIVIDVIITTNGDNEEKVQKKLDQIGVNFDGSASLVSAKTKFNKDGKKSWWNWGNNNVNMKINYIIKMPITNNVDLSNDYGSIDLDTLEGRAEISCDYGKITTKELLADNNVINFDYTKNSYMEYVKSGSINADYSDYTVAKTNSLDINADYTKSNIKMAEDVTYNNDYGSLTVDKVNNVKGNGDYLSLQLGDVYQSVSVKADYGSMRVENMAANAGDITVESDYMKITIGFDSGYNFDFELDLSHASLNGSEGLTISKERVKSSEKYYQGFHGKSNSGNNINITSEYGSVSFNKN